MSALKLVIMIEAVRKNDAQRLAGLVADYAEEQFEVYTTKHGRPMGIYSRTMTPKQERDEYERRTQPMWMALVELMEWWDDLPNDTRGLLDDDGTEVPSFIKRAREIIPARDK